MHCQQLSDRIALPSPPPFCLCWWRSACTTPEFSCTTCAIKDARKSASGGGFPVQWFAFSANASNSSTAARSSATDIVWRASGAYLAVNVFSSVVYSSDFFSFELIQIRFLLCQRKPAASASTTLENPTGGVLKAGRVVYVLLAPTTPIPPRTASSLATGLRGAYSQPLHRIVRPGDRAALGPRSQGLTNIWQPL